MTKWLRRLATLAALGFTGAVGASSNQPIGDKWTANADEQFLLDVNIRQLKLGDGVRAYDTPTGTCVVFGDFLTTLDVPMKLDLTSKTASGWAFKEANKINIDFGAMTARYRDKTETIEPGTIRETPEGWCIQSTALGRWFGIGVKPMTSGSIILLESEAKLPVEMAMERKRRAAQIKPAKFDLGELPQVRLPYRMWRAPALDFVVSAGATYRANDGVRVDRRSSVLAAGEIARLSYDAQMSTDDKGKPNIARFHAYRSDPEGELLGPLHATHFGVGDVAAFDSRLSGNPRTGRGAVVTNRPLMARAAFDRTRFEGDLPIGWEAEIYRNGELLAFAKPTADQRYSFEDVQLLYGENEISIIMYGPQGQVRTRNEVVNVGQDNVPPGQTWYWAGFNQPGRDLAPLERPPDAVPEARSQATISVEHGLDERTSAGVLARMMLVGDERVTVVEGSVRRSIGKTMVEVSAARETSGGTAIRTQMLGKFGKLNVSIEGLLANDFHLLGGRERTIREGRMGLDAPVRIGRQLVSTHAAAHFRSLEDGSREVEASARLATTIDRFNLATDLRYRKQLLSFGAPNPGEINLGLLGSGRIGHVRLSGAASFDIAPRTRFRTAELSAYWSKSENIDWEGGLVYDMASKRGRARVTHVRRLNSMAIALSAEGATDRSFAAGVNLIFSIDPNSRFKLSRRPIAGAGAVRARVYRDLNDNGLWDIGEPAEKGALITTGARPSEKATDAKGLTLVGGLTAFDPIAVGLDTSSLSDPMLVPRKALQVVTPRPGVPAQVDIGLVGGGDVEGALVKNGGMGFEGVTLELLDANGKVVATAQTDYDGFFLFERVPYGKYRIAVAKDSATAARLSRDLPGQVVVTPEHSVVRMGSIQVSPIAQIAAN
ncbi:MAG: SdrD B-like domain-containing protein [Sphingomicrobium sp.]